MMHTFIAITGAGLARAVPAGEGRWTVETALDGQEITCLAADPLQAGVVYAGTPDKGLLCSTDQGETWSPVGLDGQLVKAIGVSRLVPGRLYVGTKPACIFVSPDSGRHWEELPAFRRIFSRRFWFSPAEPPYKAYVQGIALSPIDPNVILAGIEFGAVVRSTDGGASWQDHRPGALRDCHSLTFHDTNGNWVYEAGGTGAGAAISQDGGDHWQQTKAGLDRHYGWACAADPLRPEVCYVSVSPSPAKAHGGKNAEAFIYRSKPDGEWQKLGGGLPQPLEAMPYALLTDPQEPGTVYAGLSSGDVWRSEDLGETWNPLPFNLHSIHRSLVLL